MRKEEGDEEKVKEDWEDEEKDERRGKKKRIFMFYERIVLRY